MLRSTAGASTSGGSPITGTTITATTGFAAPSGTSSIAGLYWAADGTGAGWYRNGATQWTLASAGSPSFTFIPGGRLNLASSVSLAWGSGDSTTTPDVTLVRDAANTLAQKNGNNAQTANHYAGNGGFHSLVAFNESLTIAASATTDSATTIPAGAQIVAVSVRVTTVIPTAATFTVTATTGGTTFNTAAVSVAANSTDAGTAAGGATYTSAGTKIRITPNLTPGAATGVVRICGYYRLITPPTS